jgi:hypothetical protein
MNITENLSSSIGHDFFARASETSLGDELIEKKIQKLNILIATKSRDELMKAITDDPEKLTIYTFASAVNTLTRLSSMAEIMMAQGFTRDELVKASVHFLHSQDVKLIGVHFKMLFQYWEEIVEVKDKGELEALLCQLFCDILEGFLEKLI